MCLFCPKPPCLSVPAVAHTLPQHSSTAVNTPVKAQNSPDAGFFPKQCHSGSTQSSSHSTEKIFCFQWFELGPIAAILRLPPSAPRPPANRSSPGCTHDYVLLSVNRLIYSACKKMWSSSITCVVARLVCACVCVKEVGGACMWECMCLFTCVKARKEREVGRVREGERFVRHLYLQTTG